VYAWHVALIILGTHGRAGIIRLLLGSTAEVVSYCSRPRAPVIIVPTSASVAGVVCERLRPGARRAAGQAQTPTVFGLCQEEVVCLVWVSKSSW
jgi:universal stress protein family protein